MIIIFLKPEDSKFGDKVQRISFKYPSVKVKLIDISKQPLMSSKHNVKEFPSVLLLKSGKEVDRVTNGSTTMIEQLFRKAHV